MMPVLLLGAAPNEPTVLKDFFSMEGKSVFELISKPPHLRYAGFDLTTVDQPKLLKGECWQVTNGARKDLRVYEDGTVIFRANADSSFLGWGQDPDKYFASPRLNPVAIVEVIYLFVIFIREIGSVFVVPPKTIHFQVDFRNAWFEGKKVLLNSGVGDSIDYRSSMNSKEAQAQAIKIEMPWSYLDVKEESEYIAFELILRLYAQFGLSSESIPYTSKDQSGRIFVDKDKIIKIR